MTAGPAGPAGVGKLLTRGFLWAAIVGGTLLLACLTCGAIAFDPR